MLFTGLANINLWYPWHFNFPDTHFRTSFIVIGALFVHIGAKFTTSRRALMRSRGTDEDAFARNERRRFLATAFGAGALGWILGVTSWLARTILLGAAKSLAARRRFSGTVNLIFQPAEESLGYSGMAAE